MTRPHPELGSAPRCRLLPSARHLVPTSLAVLACAAVSTAATSSGVRSPWYEGLEKPSFQPPREAFPIAWTLLYADIALTSARALDELPPDERRRFAVALAKNLGLNAAWCWTFFARRELALSVPLAGLLALSSADLARRAGRGRRRDGLALSPYVAWTAFAAALNDAIAVRNLEN